MAWAAPGIVATSIATVTVGAKLTDTAIARNVFAVLVRKPRRRSAWSLQDPSRGTAASPLPGAVEPAPATTLARPSGNGDASIILTPLTRLSTMTYRFHKDPAVWIGCTKNPSHGVTRVALAQHQSITIPGP